MCSQSDYPPYDDTSSPDNGVDWQRIRELRIEKLHHDADAARHSLARRSRTEPDAWMVARRRRIEEAGE